MSKTQDFDLTSNLGMKLLDSQTAHFERTSGGFASLKTADCFYERVTLLRAFPLSDPDRYISVREADEHKKEIGVIENINNLSKEDAEIVREQLNLRYFTPKIKKVLSVKDKHGFSTLEVITDKGKCKFTFKTGSNSVVGLSESRYLFHDIDGSRYEIEDIFALSKREQKKLDIYI